MIKDGATTSGCSTRQKFICILKRKPLSTAAIRPAESARQHGDTEEAQQKESVIRNRHGQKPRYLQRTRALREGHRHAQTLQDYLTATENRRRRFSLRFFLIAAIYNIELKTA